MHSKIHFQQISVFCFLLLQYFAIIDDSSCTKQIFVQSNALFYAPPPSSLETITRTITNTVLIIIQILWEYSSPNQNYNNNNTVEQYHWKYFQNDFFPPANKR